MSRRPGVLAVHSVDHVAFTVPALAEAERFFNTFGLDTRREGARLDVRAHGDAHRWLAIHEAGTAKRLQFISFGIFAEDEAAFRQRIEAAGIGCAPHPLSDGQGLWLRDPDGTPMQLKVAPKVSPSVRSVPSPVKAVPAGAGAAPARSKAAPVRPRRLSHVLKFTPDVPRMIDFCEHVLGIRLSDKSADIVAFLHSAHGSDHHMIAFAKSGGPGLHHTSWDVGSVDEVGCGSEQMRAAGFTEGWGVGRHVLGSNYFYYARDPWGSYAEFSFDIDHIPATLDWPAGDHPPEDSFYLWGPQVPEDFVTNFEVSA
jgi:catechol 2,3-dioxygenase-like lactoylglutathione lyase family enzyme